MTTTTNLNDNVKSVLRSQPRIVRELLAGGIAGGIAKTCVAPLERIKILFQTGRISNVSVPTALVVLARTEGVRGLFKGNSASVLRVVPYAAIHFGLYENFRRAIVGSFARSSGAGHLHPGWDLVAGSLSGATAVVCTYPLDLVRTQLAWHTEMSAPPQGGMAAAAAGSGSRGGAGAGTSTGSGGGGAGAGKGGGTGVATWRRSARHHTIRSMLLQTARQEGVVGLYKGALPTLLGIMPYSGIKFYVYNALKQAYQSRVAAEKQQLAAEQASERVAAAASAGGEVPARAPSSLPAVAAKHPDAARLPIGVMLAIGGVAGLVAQTVTYPLDVIRRRMQVDVRSASGQWQSGHSMLGAARTVMREQGSWLGLFRGLSINYIKVAPSTAVGFTVYDALKSYLNVQGGSVV